MDLPLEVAADRTTNDCGAVLSHIMSDGSERPIKFITHLFNDTRRKYSMVDEKAFAIVYAMR